MKAILIFLIALSITSISLAQKPDKVLARVRYSFIHARDTTQKNDPYTENMLLLVGKNTSLYTSYDRINRIIASKKADEAYIKAQAGGTPIVMKSSTEPFKPVTLVDLFFFNNEHQLITNDRVMTDYLVVEETPQIDWKLSKDTTSFSGISCKKATAHFKGRNWIAWYAPNLPFQSGPWKLNGLPGLIIEAHDDKNEVKFQFSGISNIKKEDIDESNFYLGAEIKLNPAAQKTSRAEFDKLKAAFDKDPQGFHAAAAGIPRNRVFAGRSTNGVVHNVINNPLELPEKGQ